MFKKIIIIIIIIIIFIKINIKISKMTFIFGENKSSRPPLSPKKLDLLLYYIRINENYRIQL